MDPIQDANVRLEISAYERLMALFFPFVARWPIEVPKPPAEKSEEAPA